MITLFIWIVLVGLIVTAIYRWMPIPTEFKHLCLVVGILWVVLLTLHAFGISLNAVPNPRLK